MFFSRRASPYVHIGGGGVSQVQNIIRVEIQYASDTYKHYFNVGMLW